MELFFTEQGSGYPVVLLHGFPFDHHVWDLLRPHLSGDLRFIFPDLRGFGSSKITKREYGMSDMAEDVIELLDALKIKRAGLAGHSMGGYVALEVVSQIPERIEGVALIASHIYADQPDTRIDRVAQIEHFRTEDPTEVISRMPAKLCYDEYLREYCRQAIQKTDRIGAQGALNAMANRPSAEMLWRELEIPQLVLAGCQDQLNVPEVSDHVARTGKNVIYTILENAGHMLMREQPLVTAVELEKFIRTVRRE
jgi:pimeloyl-ACP methyl ester carboxylesterase